MPKAGLVTITEIKEYREKFEELTRDMQKGGMSIEEVYALIVYAWCEQIMPTNRREDA